MKSLFLALLCLLASPAFAHKGHHHEALTSTATVSGAAVTSTAKIDWPVLIKTAAASHRHNKVVHFPIALGLVGVLFLILGVRYESLRISGRWLLFLAGLSGIVALITGHAQAHDIEGQALKQVLEIHEDLGTAVVISIWAILLLSFVKSSSRWLWILLLLLAAAIVAEGNLGGILAHMQL